MNTRAMLFGALAALVALAAVAALFTFQSWGKAMYRPGDLRTKAAKGLVDLEPYGKLVWGTRRADGTEEFRIEVERGIALAGFRRGEGRPAIVIFGGPGYPSNEAWRGLGAFEARRSFYYYHQRGSGLSTRPFDRFGAGSYPAKVAALEARLGLAQQIADVERLRRAIDVETIDLVGHSFGGFIAALYAIEFPEHTGKLLLVAPAELVALPQKDGGLYEQVRRLLPESRRASYRAWLGEFFDYGRIFSRGEEEMRKINAGFIPFYQAACAARGTPNETIGATDPALIGGWMMEAIFFSMGRSHDYSAALSRISAPATMVFGTGDTGGAAMFDQYRVIPGLKEVPIPGGDHFIADDAELFPRAASSFFE